jgi:hypothetical protein
MFRMAVKKLFYWIFSSVLVSLRGGPGLIRSTCDLGLKAPGPTKGIQVWVVRGWLGYEGGMSSNLGRNMLLHKVRPK